MCLKEQMAWPGLGANNCNPCPPPPPLSTSAYQEAQTLLSNSQRCQWRRATGDYSPSTDPINRLARHEQTTIFRLRTGHCGLRTHLKRIGIMDSALCDCKEAEQTVHHILQDCPVWRKQRHQLWQQNRRSITSSRTVPSGGNRDTSYGRRTSQPLTSCEERRKTCIAPSNSWQHVD